MELPDETFVNIHNFDAPGETWGKFSSCYIPYAYSLHCALSSIHEVVSDARMQRRKRLTNFWPAIRVLKKTRRTVRTSGSRVTLVRFYAEVPQPLFR